MKSGRKRPFRRCFQHPFHRTQTPRLESLHRKTVAHVFDIHSHSPSPPPPFLRGAYFGSPSSVPKMDLSSSTLRIMARGIYRTVLPTGLRPRLPIHRRPLNSGVYSLFSLTHALSHGYATVATPPCPFSSTLDRTRVP
jgi:hypothetical protein